MCVEQEIGSSAVAPYRAILEAARERASLGDVSGSWRDSVNCVNALIDDLVHPTSETARVIGAVAQGDLSQTMALEVDDRALQGEFLRTAKTINKMVQQLRAPACG